MTGKWFWCPKCHKIAPQLTKREVAKIKSKDEDSDESERNEKVIRRIAFTLANPSLMLKLYFQSFVNRNKSLYCGPCGSIKMELLEKGSPKMLSAPNYEDLVKAGLIKG